MSIVDYFDVDFTQPFVIDKLFCCPFRSIATIFNREKTSDISKCCADISVVISVEMQQHDFAIDPATHVDQRRAISVDNFGDNFVGQWATDLRTFTCVAENRKAQDKYR